MPLPSARQVLSPFSRASASAQLTLTTRATPRRASVNLKNDVKGFDLAVPVGLSYEFKHFVLDARYTFDLTKVFDDFDTKNLTFQLTLGYKIDL